MSSGGDVVFRPTASVHSSASSPFRRSGMIRGFTHLSPVRLDSTYSDSDYHSGSSFHSSRSSHPGSLFLDSEMEDDSCLDDLDASLFDDSSTTAIAATTTRRILETAQQPASSPRQSECGGGGPAVPTTPTESAMFTPACTAAPTLDIPFPEGLAARNKHNNNYGDDEDSGEEDASALSSRGRRRPQNPVAPPPPPPPPRPSQNPMDRFSFVAKKKASLCSEALDRNNRRGMTPVVNNTPKAAARASPGLICSPPENTRLAAPTTAPATAMATATATATATAVQQQQQHGGWEESSMSHTTAGSTVYTQIAVAVAASVKSAVRGGAHGATRGSNGGDSSSKVAIQEELPAHPPTPPPRPSLDMHSGGSFSYATTFAAKFKAQQSNPGSRSSKIAATTSASPSLASVKENVGDEESLRTLSSALLTSAVLGSTWQSGASAVDEIAKEKGQEEEEKEEEGDADDGGGGGGYDNVVGEDDEAVVILDQPADFAIESDDRDSGSSSNGLGALQLQSPTPAHILHDSKQSSPSLTRAKVQCLKKRSWLATLRDAGSSATIIDKSG